MNNPNIQSPDILISNILTDLHRLVDMFIQYVIQYKLYYTVPFVDEVVNLSAYISCYNPEYYTQRELPQHPIPLDVKT